MNEAFRELQFRDGSAEHQRLLKALNTDYAMVDERSMQDMIRFAQSYAKQLDFYHVNAQADLKVDGDWTSFFSGDPEEIASFMEQPELFKSDGVKMHQLTRPSLVLYMVFLELLKHPQKALNELTEKHLNFYYETVLGMVKKSAVPDQVNVIVQLQDDLTRYELPAGTLLDAGEDSEGNPLVYETDRNLLIDHSQIVSLKTLHIERQIIGIEEAHELNREELDFGFGAMMELALGDPNPGDFVPRFPAGIKTFKALHEALTSSEAAVAEEAKDYVQDKLFLPISDFQYLMELKDKDEDNAKEVTTEDWDYAYKLLGTAYKNKQYALRQIEIGQVHEDFRTLYKEQDDREGKALHSLMGVILGELRPDPLDDSIQYKQLPVFPSKADTLDEVNEMLKFVIPDDLYESREGNDDVDVVVDEALREQLQNARKKHRAEFYIEEILFLSPEDLDKIITTKDQQHSANAANPDEEVAKLEGWLEVYEILQVAEKAKNTLPDPVPEKQIWHNIYVAQDATLNTVRALYESNKSQPRWRTFGDPVANQEEPATEPGEFGWGIASPLLNLNEGERFIRVTLDLDAGSYDEDRMEASFSFGSDKTPAEITEALPFAFYLSVGQEWRSLEVEAVDYGTCISDVPGEPYEARLNGDKTVVTKTAGTDFTDQDIGSFIAWSDGIIYKIVARTSAEAVEVEPFGEVDAHEGIRKYHAQGVYNEALQFTFVFNEKYDPIVEADPELDELPFSEYQSRRWPMLRMMLKPVDAKESSDTESSTGPEKSARLWFYQRFQQLVCLKINLSVEVKDMLNTLLYNDEGALDGQSPFDPFGITPVIGSRFFLTHPELILKRLDTLSLDIEWMEAPKLFKDYYANYWKIKANDPELAESEYVVQGNDSFQTKFGFYDNRTPLLLKEAVPLFDTTDARKPYAVTFHNIANLIHEYYYPIRYDTYRYEMDLKNPSLEEGVLDQSRYFYCELSPIDFQHTVYDNILFQQAFTNTSLLPTEESVLALKQEVLTLQQEILAMEEGSLPSNAEILAGKKEILASKKSVLASKETTLASNSAIEGLALQQAYTPKIKAMHVGYTASVELSLGEDWKAAEREDVQLFHFHPFGHKTLTENDNAIQVPNSAEKKRYLFPQFLNEGELYIGLSDFKPLESSQLSLLFQMAEGSMDPEVDSPTVKWSYLSTNQWLSMDDHVVQDTTSNLTKTGLIVVNVPDTITSGNTLFPAENHWIKVSAARDTNGASDIIAIHPRAVRAVLQDNDNAAEHFEKPLPSYTITGTVNSIVEVDSIEQPYTSEGGRPKEESKTFYNRISERLRHKNRALNLWDYERIVLEEFPNIYKAKCLFAELEEEWDEPGKVEVIVVPNIRNQHPFTPFEPKAPTKVLETIEAHLKKITSPFANICVRNPTYQPVMVRVAIHFKEGYNVNFYKQQANEDLKSFLAPWAYDPYAHIPFGNTIYGNEVVNFLEERPYVEFVAAIKLFLHQGGTRFISVETLQAEEDLTPASTDPDADENVVKSLDTIKEYAAAATLPDAILVSAAEHIIDVIDGDIYTVVENLYGIGYLQIFLDFEVD